jgi:hypothetical protein
MHWEVCTRHYSQRLWAFTQIDGRQLLRALCAALGLLAVPACESTVVVASGCKDGVCPLVQGADACLLRTTTRKVVFRAPLESGPVPGICLPNTLPRDSHGLVAARLHWVLPRAEDATLGTPVHCREVPFLSPLDLAFDAEYQAQYPGQEVCDVAQLPVETVAGELIAPTDSGFFYDDFTVERTTSCGVNPARIAYAGFAVPPVAVLAIVSTDETLRDVARVCRVAPSNSLVGTSCLPSVEDYDLSQSVLETQSKACGGRACLAYHLEGSLADDCVEPSVVRVCSVNDTPCVAPKPCVSAETLAHNAFCSCRCDAPDGDAELCKCGSGFSCVPVFEDGDPGIVGSYCVPSSLAPPPT